MACKYYDITISSIDLAGAVNNTDPLNDGVIFAQYLDCNLTNTITVYDTAGYYPNAFCADDSQGVVLYYFNNNNQNLAFNSTWTAVGICTVPTPTPTPECGEGCQCYTVYNPNGFTCEVSYLDCVGLNLINTIVPALGTTYYCVCNDGSINDLDGCGLIITPGGSCFSADDCVPLPPTPTPTPTLIECTDCICKEIISERGDDCTFTYTDCYGVTQVNGFVGAGQTVYYCVCLENDQILFDCDGSDIFIYSNGGCADLQNCDSQVTPTPTPTPVVICWEADNSQGIDECSISYIDCNTNDITSTLVLPGEIITFCSNSLISDPCHICHPTGNNCTNCVCDVEPTPTETPTPEPSATPTPTPTPSATPTTTPTPTPSSTPTPTPSATPEPSATPTNTPIPTATPTQTLPFGKCYEIAVPNGTGVWPSELTDGVDDLYISYFDNYGVNQVVNMVTTLPYDDVIRPGYNTYYLCLLDGSGAGDFQYGILGPPVVLVNTIIIPLGTGCLSNGDCFPEPTPTPLPCQCIEYTDTSGGIGYSYIDCSGDRVTSTTPLGPTPFTFNVCGSDPTSEDPKLTFIIDGLCSNGVDCDLAPTPTALPCTIWEWEIYGSSTASIDYYNCDNVFTTLPITSGPSGISGNICVYPLTTPVWNPAPTVSHSLGTSGIVCLSPTQTPTPTPTETPTPTPTTALGCFSGITDNPVFWEYYDCCGEYQSGSGIGINICIDTSQPYQGVATYTGNPCTPNCPTPTPTETPTPTPTPVTYYFVDCCDPSIKFGIVGLPGILNLGEVYNITITGVYTGCAEVNTDPDGTVYSSNDSVLVGPYVSCSDCVECPTPTPTIEPTPTPTPTATPNVSCNCVEVVISRTDISSATGNTNPSLNHIVNIGDAYECNGGILNYNFTKATTKCFCLDNQPVIPTPTPTEPVVDCLESLEIVIEYDSSQFASGSICAGGHTCNSAVFTVLANTVNIGTVSLNNIGGVYDQKNLPPGYNPLPSNWTINYSNINQYNTSPRSDVDRYGSVSISTSQAISIAALDPSGQVQLNFVNGCVAGVTCPSTYLHSGVNWVRVYRDSQLIYSGCPTGNALTFNPCVAAPIVTPTGPIPTPIPYIINPIITYYQDDVLVTADNSSFTIGDNCTTSNDCCRCEFETYCLDTGGVVPYDGEFTFEGKYNDRDYYVHTNGSTIDSYIFFDGDKWCLSDTLGGDCILFGNVPCNTFCPEICENCLTEGDCEITPTPTPGPCDDFDFNALFNCYVPGPTPTPTQTTTPKPTATPAATPTPTPDCSGKGLTLSATTVVIITPTPTPTPTTTVLPKICYTGDVVYNLFDETFMCSTTKKLTNCQSGEEYYLVDPIQYNDINIETGVTITAVINDNLVCVTYDGLSNISSNSTLSAVTGIMGYGCENCNLPTPTPTPSPTVPITPTPTHTPITTPTPKPTQTPASTINIITSTPTPTPTSTPQNTATPTPTKTSTPTPTPTTTIECFEVFVENITSGNPNGSSSIRFPYTACSGNPQMTTPVTIGKGACIFTNNMGSISGIWADNSTPPPVNGVDYQLTIDGCL